MRVKIVKGNVRSALGLEHLRLRHAGTEERVAVELPYFGVLPFRAVVQEPGLPEGAVESRFRNDWAPSKRRPSMRSPISRGLDSPSDRVDLAGELDRKEMPDRHLTVSPELRRAGQFLIDRDETFICDDTTIASFVLPDSDAGL
jgi:hypothetical protein